MPVVVLLHPVFDIFIFNVFLNIDTNGRNREPGSCSVMNSLFRRKKILKQNTIKISGFGLKPKLVLNFWMHGSPAVSGKFILISKCQLEAALH